MLTIQIQQNINILFKNEGKKWSWNLKDQKAFTEYSNTMQNVYKNIEDYNPSSKYNVLIVFDYMIADMIIKQKI